MRINSWGVQGRPDMLIYGLCDKSPPISGRRPPLDPPVWGTSVDSAVASVTCRQGCLLNTLPPTCHSAPTDPSLPSICCRSISCSLSCHSLAFFFFDPLSQISPKHFFSPAGSLLPILLQRLILSPHSFPPPYYSWPLRPLPHLPLNLSHPFYHSLWHYETLRVLHVVQFLNLNSVA